MIDPRLRQRVEVVPVRPGIKIGVTNSELVESFLRTSKFSKGALASYRSVIRDFVRYMKHPDGREIPARDWVKDAVWAYLHFVEANYCAYFRTIPLDAALAVCRKRVFVGAKNAELAVAENCRGCPTFKSPTIAHRVNALSKFFKFLAKVGAIPLNFMADVVTEWWDENPIRDQDEEKRRNPSVEEERKLVNGTTHPQRRGYYATSAKWWYRPNEMFLLDRYASFGAKPPAGVPTPDGFEDGFAKHPELKPFDEGGDLVYLPKKPGRPDKRQGNRWMVIDAEIRPILEQHFAWWERMVKRDAAGRPVTTALWITERGTALRQSLMYRTMFSDDCIRLGLMRPEDTDDMRRAWTSHCQRHFGEKLLEMHNVPDVWCNHFRGDKLRDARGHYFKPGPHDVRKKYHELVPLLGLEPLSEARGYLGGARGEAEMHRATLKAELARVNAQKRRTVQAASIVIACKDERIVVPRRIVAAVLFALRIEKPSAEWTLVPDQGGNPGREFEKDAVRTICTRASRALSP